MIQAQEIELSRLVPNRGQIEGVPTNPRKHTKECVERMKKSIKETPLMLEVNELTAYDNNGELVIIRGNLRYKALKALGRKTAPVKILPADTPKETVNEIVIKDNVHYGDWDVDMLSSEWDKDQITDWGIDTAGWFKEEKPKKEKEEEEPEDDQDEEEDEKEEFYRSMFKDVLYESDNIYEIPNLLLEQQAGRLELPLTPWGANSRLRKDVATYHFYVDDYRFEALFKDPVNLILSGCKAIVEPNCSCHDQTPLAWGLQLIYKKRWLSRYLQECGVKVYADLNVSHKFIEYNKMGIPKGYNAFFTRGLDNWMESLKSDLEVAQEISGLEKPNLIVYGGGKEVQQFCREKGLLYVTDFINAKKI